MKQRASIATVPEYLPDQPVLTTRHREWPGITLDVHAPAPHYLVSAPAHDHHLICFCPAGRGRLIQRRDGKIHDSVISPGMSLLMPSGYDSVWEGEAATSARLRIPTALIEKAAAEIGARARSDVEILNVFGRFDPTIEHFSRLLLAELVKRPHPSQPMIAEAVSYGLVAHLLRDYNAFGSPKAGLRVTASSRAIGSVIDYIESHLDEPVSLAGLADIARVSRFHFLRIFKQSTGFTPMAYLERSRIRKAQELLQAGKLSLSDVALAVGFADQSHFIRRFRRHVGVAPSVFAREQGVARLPRRPRLL